MSERWWMRGLVAISLVSLLFAAGCSNDKAKLRVLHASPDEPALDVLLDGKTVANSLAYGSATDYLSVSGGSRQLQLNQSGGTTSVLTQSLSLSSSAPSTVIVSNFSSSINAVTLTDDNSSPTTGNIKLRFVNAAPALGPCDVYVVAPGTDITTVTPTISNLAFEAASIYQVLPAANYEVFITPAGSNFAIIDSGPLTLNALQVRTLVALDSLSGGFTSTTLSDAN
jgi:hypothetical protein